MVVEDRRERPTLGRAVARLARMQLGETSAGPRSPAWGKVSEDVVRFRRRRGAGLLLHVTSLPGPQLTGDLGDEAHAFVDFLGRAGQCAWQMLPIHPPGAGDSPYSSPSAFAGNPQLISLRRLAERGLLRTDEAEAGLSTASPTAQGALLRRAVEAFLRSPGVERDRFEAFASSEAAWLDDFARHRVLSELTRLPWWSWEEPLRRREPSELARVDDALAEPLRWVKVEQHLFFEQWAALRAHAHARGVELIGDVPFFVALDSADVWSHPESFLLDDDDQRPTRVAGVPPDMFSRTGQLWGNPLYRWNRMRRDGYAWWIARLGHELATFDRVRLDHFIGFTRAWAVPAEATTAEKGRFLPGPGLDFFKALRASFGGLPFIAEDLGLVTRAVSRLRDDLQLPGMRVLQFGFGGDAGSSVHLPHNHPRRAVAYSGTHDNDTLVGWLESLREPATREGVSRYAEGPGMPARPHLLVWALLRSLYASPAGLVIVPVQDILGLGTGARMNTPGVALGNWTWRLAPGALDDACAERLSAFTETYGRSSHAEV